ncbi:MAG: acyl-CoA dehydrogenase family protein, partial [Solirubrobacteraceae bacterium]
MTTSSPPFSDEHEQLRQSIRGFIERELAPHAQRWEDERWFPDDVFPKLAAQGLLGLKYPESYGGQGGDYLHEAVLCEEMARVGSGGTAAGIGAHINIATPPIWKFGTEEQKQRYLVPSIRGETIGALGITEPGAGSDVAAIVTRAERVDGGWVVNGEKTYITNGVRAHFIVTAVKTKETNPPARHHDISFLIVDRSAGVTSAKLEKLGWHASDTATIAF